MKRNLLWVGAINYVCDMGLFGLSILFVDRDFDTYVFCFVGSPSIDRQNPSMD
jgi:hypothetical protein